MTAREHHLSVTRTARYFTLGLAGPALREVWVVLHGHGQLAGRFLRHFAALDDGTRMVVAPEALSRFYLEPTAWHGTGTAKVGATWMTREDRLVEMDDYVRYLDALYQRLFEEIPRAAVRLVVLGFSQGVATACRWLCRGRARAEALVLWAGPFPPELDAEAVGPLRALTLVRVLGERDQMARPGLVAAEEQRLRALGLEAPLVRFDGGHEIHAATLRSLPL